MEWQECRNCRYFQSVTDPNNIGRPLTRCVRYPPQGQAMSTPQGDAVVSVVIWPTVQPDDYCGEFAPLPGEAGHAINDGSPMS